jgi:hypothetical protein
MRNVVAARPVPTEGCFSFPGERRAKQRARRSTTLGRTGNQHLAAFRRRGAEVDRARAGRLLAADREARRAPRREGLAQLVREAVLERRGRAVAVRRDAAVKLQQRALVVVVDDAAQHVADDGRQLVVVGAVVEDGLVAHAVKVQAEVARSGGRDGDEQRDAHHENIANDGTTCRDLSTMRGGWMAPSSRAASAVITSPRLGHKFSGRRARGCSRHRVDATR